MLSPRNDNLTICHGAILVAGNTLLPEPLRLESDPAGDGWMRVANNADGDQLEKNLTSAGWKFFYMAGTITATAFGFERQRMVHAALKRLITAVRLQKCNCMEIDDVATHSFLGLPYVSISAHSRHIQKGMVFSGQ